MRPLEDNFSVEDIAMSSTLVWSDNEELFADGMACSDGIARVHGMTNVQAEELVE